MTDGNIRGFIIKNVSGLYFVTANGGVILCRARGLFRKSGQTPLAGDHVTIRVNDDGTGYIDGILPRKNALIRPPAANIDQAVIIASAAPPATSALVIDKMCVICESLGVSVVVAVNKSDLDPGADMLKTYAAAGYANLSISAATGAGINGLKALLQDKVTILTGNSGVGKSSVINAMGVVTAAIETDELSVRSGRGKHTTRTVEFFPLKSAPMGAHGGYIADSPGFSLLDEKYIPFPPKERLAEAFPEFAPYMGECRFDDCSHTREQGCAVIGARDAGRLSKSRHDSYTAIYDIVKDIKSWDKR